MVFNDLFKKLDKISINKCKKPNEPVTYQQLEHIIDNNRSIYFYDWVVFFISIIFFVWFAINTYNIGWATTQMNQFLEPSKIGTHDNKSIEYKTYKEISEYITHLKSVRPYVRSIVICFSLIVFCRASVNRINPMLKDKCITPRFVYVFNLVMILLFGYLGYQIYIWFTKTLKYYIEYGHVPKSIQDKNLKELTDGNIIIDYKNEDFVNPYLWIYLFFLLFSIVLSIIARFRKNKEDLEFYFNFLFGNEMISLLSKLYLLEIINNSTKDTVNKEYNIVFNNDNLDIQINK